MSHPHAHQHRNQWSAVLAMAMATFTVITSEMLPIGLLSAIASELNVSTGYAGLSVSAPAILGGLFAPISLLAAGTLDRKHLLCGLLILLVAANLATALAPNMAFMLTARVFVGFAIGGIWSIAGGVAAQLVQPQKIGFATAIIVGGVAAASVLGVPLGTGIGDLFGWRSAFIVMAGLSLMVLWLNIRCLPKLPVTTQVSFSAYRHLMQRPNVLLGLLLTFLLVGGHFMAFTYIRPISLTLLSLQPQWLSLVLLAYGAIGMFSNLLIGYFNSTKIAMLLFVLASSISLALFGLNHLPITSLTRAMLILLLWGAAYGGVSIGLMSWMMRAAPQAIEAVTALYISAFYLAIAVGAFAGGRIMDVKGLSANLNLAALLALAAALLSLWLMRPQRHHGQN
ncbi:MFS transporter [Neisseriaceae bacterium CLB008]